MKRIQLTFSLLGLLALELILPGLLIAGEAPVAENTTRRVINFAGRYWWVKNGTNLGPGPNNFSDSEESVWVDDAGKLHLKIRQIEASGTAPRSGPWSLPDTAITSFTWKAGWTSMTPTSSPRLSSMPMT